MGLSIHYSGKFASKSSLSEMIKEVEDIIKVYQWKYHIYETDFPDRGFEKVYNDKIYGISFIPPECEHVFFCFLSNGRMSSPSNLQIFGNSAKKDYQKYLYMLSTKTQYAGIQIHKLIIHIFRFIAEKYFSNFKMIDEGRYWETGDKNVLEENFKRYNDLMDIFSDALQNLPMTSEETFEDYFERLLNLIKKGRQK